MAVSRAPAGANSGAASLPCQAAPAFSGGSVAAFVRDNHEWFAAQRAAGVSFKHLARIVGSVSDKALQLAWMRGPYYAPKRQLRDMREEVMALKRAGKTWREVGAALGLNWNSIHVIAVREGWTRR